MAVAGAPRTEPEPGRGDAGPDDVDRGGPLEHERTPDRRRALVLAVPVAVVVAVLVAGVVGFALGQGSGGEASSADGVPASPPNTLKAQPVDVGFAADMYDHHEQAVLMSLTILGKTTDPAIRSHALQIAVGQRRESGIFEQFLADRGIDHIDPRRTVMAWMGEPVPAEQMPGLATADQLVALNAATGAEADRLFLELMIAHHEGGIHMATYAAEHAETQSMRDLASRIAFAQQGEVTELQQLLGEPAR